MFRSLPVVVAVLLCWLAPAHAADVDYRLPSHIVPVRQHVHLQLDPSRDDYRGETTIVVDVRETTGRIGIYHIGLNLESIALRGEGIDRELRADAGDWDIHWLADGEPIAPGRYEVAIEFSGRYSTDALGLHSVRFEDHDYLFTQMEAMYARRAFPLFDEPSFKIRWQLSISAPEDLTVIANTPVETREAIGDGWQHVTFMETPPLPSYLLAWAVGPLDRAPLEGMSVPGYVYAPLGHADRLGFVRRETPRIVAALEDYFGSDYPFRKLDFVAVPDFAFGAMENPGLITYRTDLLLLGDEPGGTTALTTLMVIAHEVAHIWYGDVVTMAWWNDLWLNEAFASWMAWSTVERLYPQYDPELNIPQDNAFAADQATTAKPIRRTIRGNDEIFEGLGLNYTKGHAILNMLENYVGPDVWQRAIRNYIEKHAWSNATEQDLWAAVSEASGIDVASIAGDFLNQPGYALVTIDSDGSVSQQRYRRPDAEVPDLEWSIPLNIKYKADGSIRQTFYLLDDETGAIDVPDDAEWVFPDRGGNGYYRWQIEDRQLYALLDDIDALGEREKIVLLDNAVALLEADRLSVEDYLLVLETLLKDEHPLVFLPALENVKNIGDDYVEDRTRDAFARFVDESMSARLAEIGAESRPDDGEATEQLRPRLLRMLGEYGADAKARREARAIAERFLADPGSVDVDLAREALRVTAIHDDGGLYDDYIAAYRKAGTATERSAVLQSVYFDEPKIIREHLDFLLTADVAAGDVLQSVSLYATVLDDNSAVFAWLDENLDALMAKSPAYYHPQLPQAFGGGCGETSLQRLNRFFEDREGFSASLGRANEAARACIAAKERYRPALESFLDRY